MQRRIPATSRTSLSSLTPLPTTQRFPGDQEPSADRRSDLIFAHWLTQATIARGASLAGQAGTPAGTPEGTPAGSSQTMQVWRIYDSPEYADLWYEAREAGERLRAAMLQRLYAQQRIPGGPHPDPREPGAFSARAIVAATVHALGIDIHQLPAQPTPDDPLVRANGIRAMSAATAATAPIVWLITYPPTPHRQPSRKPMLVLRADTSEVPLPRILFDMACMVGLLHRERSLLDPHAPPDTILLPTTASLLSLLHQFAIALLCLEPVCPPAWTCHCNVIHERYNAPPADHDRPTGALDLSAIKRATSRT